MAADVTLAPADAADVAAVVNDMRDIDRLEAWEIGAATPKVAVARAIRRSEQAFAIRFEGRAAGLFGATQPGELSGIATPWMVGTHALPWALKRSGPALRQAWEEVDRMLARARRLENVVHPDNAPAIRLLTSLGFTIEPPQPFGWLGRRYSRFWRERGALDVC